MTPGKKDRIQTPATITSPVEENSDSSSEVESSACPKSSVSKDNKDATC